MDINEIAKLVEILEGTDVSELEFEKEGTNIRITRSVNVPVGTTQHVVVSPQIVSATSNAPVASNGTNSIDPSLTKVESPIVGTFYRKSSPDADNFVSVGSKVSKGDTLCIVEAMKLMNEIEAPISGTIEQIFQDDGKVVEYGELLFLIRPS
jgi:acetyl-CoA carboxylase biotin carboxyl carrier protein